MSQSPARGKLPVEWVSADIIRKIFNDGQYYEQVKAGRMLAAVSPRNSHPDPAPEGEPYCTHSQIVHYYNAELKLVAIVHQYLRPDGTLGRSGRPDPKRIIFEDKIISLRSDAP